jgi:hypothetical protein
MEALNVQRMKPMLGFLGVKSSRYVRARYAGSVFGRSHAGIMRSQLSGPSLYYHIGRISNACRLRQLYHLTGSVYSDGALRITNMRLLSWRERFGAVVAV